MTYPRPAMRRDSFFSLDGEWLANGKKVKVPGCIFDEAYIIYQKEFSYQKSDARTLLHFGAVDQVASVYLNGAYLGEHKGGYLPFTFDVSDVIEEENLLRVEVTDTIDHTYPYGKQRKDRGGMWYTPIAGIWQTVWLEDVPSVYISNLKITSDLCGATVEIEIQDGDTTYKETERVDVKKPILWTPDNPHLYEDTVKRGQDSVGTYFACRTVEIAEKDGIKRFLLNGEPIFLHGVLDQGYYEGGFFFPDDPEDYEKDILRMKELGFNMLRKHIKVEPEGYYYAADRLGMLIFQDMVNNGDYHFFRDTVLGTLGVSLSDRKKVGPREKFFIEHAKATMEHLYSHPSVIGYTVFNEGWGQFNADALYDLLKKTDPNRPIDATSGWFRQKNSDFDSQHIYFRKKKLKPKDRPLLLSECGGFVRNLSSDKKSYGYGSVKTEEALTAKIADMYRTMVLPAVPLGLCGCVYTQLSDVEDEKNGLYTFDRKTCKVQKIAMQKIAKELSLTFRKKS